MRLPSVPSFLLLAVWILATFSLGGVAESYAKIHIFLGSLVSGTVIFWFWKKRGTGGAPYPETRSLAWIAVALLCLPLLQILRLPEFLLRVLGPLSRTLRFETLATLELAPEVSRFAVSLDRAATAEVFGNILVFVLFLLAAILALRDPRLRRLSVRIICAVAGAVSFFGMLHRFSGSTKMYWIFEHGWTFFGPYVNRNHAGALLAVAGALSLGSLSRRMSRTDQIGGSLLFGLISLGLLFTGSRAAVLGLGVVFLVHLLLSQRESRAASRYVMAAILGVMVTALAWHAAFFARLADTATNLAAGLEFRPQFWGYALKLFWASPLLGVGLGAFPKASPLEVGDSLWLHPEHAENDYLELLATGGLIGFALVFYLLYRLGRRWWHVIRSQDVSRTQRAFALGLLALAVNSIFSFNAPLPAHQLLAAFLLAGLLSSRRFDLLAAATLRSRIPILVVLGLGLGLWTWVSARPPLSAPAEDWVSLPSPSTASKANLGAVHVLAREAVSKDPLNSAAVYEFAISEARFGNFLRAEKAGAIARKLNPYDLYRRVQLLRALQNRAEPQVLLREIDLLLSGSSEIPLKIQMELHLDACVTALKLERTDVFESHLASAENLKARDWRLPLLKSLSSEKPLSDLTESWKRARSIHLPPSVWDRSFFTLEAFRKEKLNSQDVLSRIGRDREDLGTFLSRLSRFEKRSKLKLQLDEGVPSPRFHARGKHSLLNARWITPPQSLDIPEILEIKVKRANPELDIYVLPVNLLLEPKKLSFRLFVSSPHALKNQMVVEVDGRAFLSEDAPVQMEKNTWELVFRRVGETISSKESEQPRRVTGVGFTPFERDGRYALGPIEVFVDSTP